MNNDDAPYWNRRRSYVGPLARAARSLVDLGLVEVWEEPAEVGEGGLMLDDLAVEAVSDPENWWRYDQVAPGTPARTSPGTPACRRLTPSR